MSGRASEAQLVDRIGLPAGVAPPIRVYVNGAEWTEGTDFTVAEDHIRFHRPLRRQPQLSLGRKLMLSIGIGVYGDLRGDTLDLQYSLDGVSRMVNIPLPAVGA